MSTSEDFGNVNRRINFLKNVHSEVAPKYKKLNDDVQRAEETTVYKEAINILSEELDTSNAIFEPYLQQVVLDSQFMQKSAYIANNRTKSLDNNVCKFDCDIFVSRLSRRFKSNKRRTTKALTPNIDFEEIGREFGSTVHDVPRFEFMYGAFDSNALVKKARKRNDRFEWTKTTKSVEPTTEKLNEEENEESATAKEVEQLYEKLRKDYRANNKKPLHFFDFTTDDGSFASTVENIFHSSFLIKEGVVKVSKKESDSEVTIEPLKKEERDKLNGDTSHSILSFTKEDWFNWLEKY